MYSHVPKYNWYDTGTDALWKAFPFNILNDDSKKHWYLG